MKNRISCNSDLIVEVPKEITYHLPEGNFRARITSISPWSNPNAKDPDNWVRFLFEVDIPSLSSMQPMARRCFEKSLEGRSELRRLLTQWFGSDCMRLLGGHYDLACLVNRECEVVLRHHIDRDYKKPLVIVEGVHQCGTLKLDQEPAKVTTLPKQESGSDLDKAA